MLKDKVTYQGTIEMFSGNKKRFSFPSNNLSLDKMDVMEMAATKCKVKVENVLDVVFMKVTDNPSMGDEEVSNEDN